MAQGRRCIFDIEGDGLLYAQGEIKQVTQLWCIGAIDIDTGEEFYWGVDKQNIEEGVSFLNGCSLLLGHNAIGYDYPCLERLYPTFKRPTKAWDTLICAKAIWPAETLVEGDMKLINLGKMPPQYLKRHSLKAWGMRTGIFKTEYKGGFGAWNQEMADYLMDDCRATLALWQLIQRRAGDWPEQVFDVECRVARIIFEQWECGVSFDKDKAVALAAALRNSQATLERQLVETFGSWWEAGKVQTFATTRLVKMPEYPNIMKPRVSLKTGKPMKPYVGPPINECQAGSQYTPITRVTFTPSNRYHLGQRLQDVYGWKPKVFGRNGAPQVDESTLSEIPEAVLPEDVRKIILDYFVVTKTYAMVSSGRKAWLKMVDDTGRVHGEIDTIGAVTRRGTHKNPNLSQVPAVKMEKVVDSQGRTSEHHKRGLDGKYGWESRELFSADRGWDETGVDASSLELILLGHYLFPIDDGAFSARVCDPSRDAHREHAELAGITRAEAKTLIYLKIYGGSAYKHSLDLDPVPREDIPRWLGSKSLPALLKSLERRMGPAFVRNLDDAQKAKIAKARDNIIKMEAGIKGLKELIEGVQGAAQARGWLKGMDGSRLIVRKPHAALNTLLQAAGAMACKQWMVLTHDALEAEGLHKGTDWKQILWVHDELQFTHRPGLAGTIKEVADRCLVESGRILNLRGQFRTEGKTGRNWAECH